MIVTNYNYTLRTQQLMMIIYNSKYEREQYVTNHLSEYESIIKTG